MRLVQRDIQATEGRFLDFDTADALQRLLHHSHSPARSRHALAWPCSNERGPHKMAKQKTIKQRAEGIIADERTYDADTREAVAFALNERSRGPG
ncbi:MAG: hypothetical protein WKF84_28800 [Pyrinomonadaceae bacterium]